MSDEVGSCSKKTHTFQRCFGSSTARCSLRRSDGMSRLREGGDRCDTAASTELTSGRDEQVD